MDPVSQRTIIIEPTAWSGVSKETPPGAELRNRGNGVHLQTSERAARRRMSPDERRQQIITRAAGLFDENGYASTTMDDIA